MVSFMYSCISVLRYFVMSYFNYCVIYLLRSFVLCVWCSSSVRHICIYVVSFVRLVFLYFAMSFVISLFMQLCRYFFISPCRCFFSYFVGS